MSEVLLIGGMFGYSTSNLIWKLVCHGSIDKENCQWIVQEQKLKIPRREGIVIPLP